MGHQGGLSAGSIGVSKDYLAIRVGKMAQAIIITIIVDSRSIKSCNGAWSSWNLSPNRFREVKGGLLPVGDTIIIAQRCDKTTMEKAQMFLLTESNLESMRQMEGKEHTHKL